MGWTCAWMMNLLRLRGVSRLPEGEVPPPWANQLEEGVAGCHEQVEREPTKGRYFVNSLEGIEEEQEDEERTAMTKESADVIDELTREDVEILEG